jgi:hypothetical protein
MSFKEVNGYQSGLSTVWNTTWQWKGEKYWYMQQPMLSEKNPWKFPKCTIPLVWHFWGKTMKVKNIPVTVSEEQGTKGWGGYRRMTQRGTWWWWWQWS